MPMVLVKKMMPPRILAPSLPMQDMDTYLKCKTIKLHHSLLELQEEI